MASTSKFLQLTPQILVEYIYRDPINPEIIETDSNGAKILILNNSYTNTNFLFNEDNPNKYTGNFRYYSSIPITSNRSKYAYLTTNTSLQYLDYDQNLITSSQLLSQLTGSYNIPTKFIHYDTIKIHLISGFDFFENDGIIFEVLIRDKAGNKHNIASLTYLKTDNYEINNPKPLLIGERLYTNYILLKVPSLDWMTSDYLASPGNTNLLGNQLTSNNGLLTQNTIELSVKFIVQTETINGQIYFYVGEASSASINKSDEYSLLNAMIKESDNGDYFEIYGEYAGDIYEDFIISLNSQPNTDIIVVHDINVIEQIGTDFVLTSEQSFIQTNDFDQPYVFRPVILNSHIAVSYRIDYTMRLLNKVDNTQIIKTAQYSSFDVKKYGRRIRKINLGTVPKVTKVYNVLPESTNSVVLNNPVSVFSVTGENKILKETQFVMGFRERMKISAAAGTVKIVPAEQAESDILSTTQDQIVKSSSELISVTSLTPTDKIWAQGEGSITISPFDNFIMFVLYDNTLQEATGSSQPQLLDLTNMGTLYLTFRDEDTGDEIRISNYTNVKDISPTRGEVLFKITKEESNKILKYKTNNFYISSRLELNDSKSDETLIYFGSWYRVDESIEVKASEEINRLSRQLTELNNQSASEIASLSSELDKLKEENQKLTADNNNLKKALLQASEMLMQYNNSMAEAVKQQTVDASINTSQITKDNIVSKVKIKQSKGAEQFIAQNLFNSVKGSNIKTINLIETTGKQKKN